MNAHPVRTEWRRHKPKTKNQFPIAYKLAITLIILASKKKKKKTDERTLYYLQSAKIFFLLGLRGTIGRVVQWVKGLGLGY